MPASSKWVALTQAGHEIGIPRQPVDFDWQGKALVNRETVSWPRTECGWGTITGFALFDSATGGPALFEGRLDMDRQVGPGDQVQFLPGAIRITLGDEMDLPDYVTAAPLMTGVTSSVWMPATTTIPYEAEVLPELEPLTVPSRGDTQCPICGEWVARGEMCWH